MALKSDGTVSAWGPNRFGELGNGNSIYSFAPSSVKALTGAVAVDGGAWHSMALKSDGTVWRWGCEWVQHEGIGGDFAGCQSGEVLLPEAVASLSDVVAIAAGGEQSLALEGDGTVWAWGWNLDGLGNGTDDPVAVSNLNGVMAIAAGDFHSLALKSGGEVWAWGANRDGQLGNGTDGWDNSSYDPVPVSNPNGVVAIAAGGFHSLALKSDGTVWTWGANYSGQLGNGSRINSNVPVAVVNLTDVVAIAGGYRHSLALKSDGTVWAWGSNYDGQLGNGTNADSDVPAPMSNLTGVVAISAGADSLALKSGGAVWASGRQLDEYGCLGVRSNAPVWVGNLSAVAIAAGYYHSLAVIRGGIPGLTLGTKAINFGNQHVGATNPARAISVTNTGDQPLEIKAVTLLGIKAGEFTKTSDTCTAAFLPAGGSCGISVKFVPVSQGNRSAAFLITSNAPRSPHLVTLRGTAAVPSAAGVFLDGKWYLDVNGNSVWEPGVDRQTSFGWAGTTQVLGDWNGDGKTEIGVFHQGSWYLDYNGNGIWDGGLTARLRRKLSGEQ